MNIRDLKLGTRLELEILDNNGNRAGNTYVSQVLEPVFGNSLVISAPIYESRLIYVPLNCKVRLAFYHSRYGVCGFTAIITSREQRGNLSALCVQAETSLNKIQRRKHYRLVCTLNAEYAIPAKGASTGESDKPRYKKALTRNLSGSGVSIAADEEIAKNSVLDIRITLSDALTVNSKCRVLRCKPMDMDKIRKYELALQFTDISSGSQDNIIKYIFEQQRLLLKKDLI